MSAPFGRLDRALIGAARAHRRRAADLLAPLDLYPGQEILLTVLRRRTSATQAQLARILRIEAPTMAVMLRRLETAGFVTRSADAVDGRVRIVTLTDLGRRTAEHVEVVLGVLTGQALTALGPDDAEILTALLERLIAAYADDPPAPREEQPDESPGSS